MKRAVAIWCVLVVSLPTWGAGEEEAGRRSHFLTPRELADLGDKSKVHYATTTVKSGTDLPSFRHPGLPKGGPLQETPYPEISTGPDGSRALSSFRLSPIARKALEEADSLFQSKENAKALP